MELNCSNIGMINQANINIDGITVIAGENDTGKSTISKLIYTLIKSADKSDVLRIYKQQKINQLREALDDIIISNRKKSNVDENEDLSFDYIFPANLLEMIIDIYIKTDDGLDAESEINELIYTFFDRDRKIDSDIIKEIINKILEMLGEEKDDLRICRYKFVNYIKSIFKGDISNKYSDKEAHISIKEGKLEFLKIIIDNNELREFNLIDQLTIQDATFVESPFILQMANLIYNARTTLEQNDSFSFLFDKPFVSIQMKDLISKLRQPIKPEVLEEAYHPVSEIIKGSMAFDKSQDSFLFNKDGKEFDVANIASGIKSFGVLQMLLQKGFLQKRNILILDEPEVNIHPKWQIEYARLLVNLVEHFGFSVLLTSHSPYFIEAIKTYGDKSKIKNDIHFYMAERQVDHKTVNILPIKNTLEKIFDELTAPLEKLEIDELGDSNDREN